MHQEKYSLTWHAFSDHLKNMMKELMMNEDFADVTLITEDKKQINANMSVLSACSPVFKDILKKDKNSSAIMYLRGIQYSEMESIMKYIYLGEAKCYEERMDEFLAVAKSLEIKEFCENETGKNDKPSETLSPKEVEKEVVMSDQKIYSQEIEELCKTETGTNDEPRVTSSPVTISDHKPKQGYQSVMYKCDQCDYQNHRKDKRATHIQSKHEGVKYYCDQCDYKANLQDGLTKHIRSKHDGIKYACDQCDYEANRKDNLTNHVKSKHEERQANQLDGSGVMYECGQCDFQFTHQSSLTKHIQSKHEGVKYACDQCDYQATQKSSLTRHFKRKH